MLRFLQHHTYLLIVPILSVMVPGIIWTQEGPPAQFPAMEITLWVDTLDAADSMASYMIPVIDISPWEATRASISLLKNDQQRLPFHQLHGQAYYALVVGEPLPDFLHDLEHYAPCEVQQVKELQKTRYQDIPEGANIIVGFNQEEVNEYALRNFIHNLSKRGEVNIVNFGHEKLLSVLREVPVLVHAPNDNAISQKIVAQGLFGGIGLTGGLEPALATQLGLDTIYQSAPIRLAYAAPEYVGIPADSLRKIDQIVEEAINSYALPGCQVLIAKEGKVIYNQAFGYHTYQKKQAVETNDLYDIASVTKIAATTLATMKLYEDGAIGLSDPLGKFFEDDSYLANGYKVYDTLSSEAFAMKRAKWQADSLTPKLDTTQLSDSLYLVGRWIKEARVWRESRVFNIPVRDLLTHTSGLQPSLPIENYKRRQDKDLFHFASDRKYSVPVAENLYLNQTWLDSIWNTTKGLAIADTARYRYSCVNMILMQRVIDSLQREKESSMEHYLRQEFYDKLGLQTMTYNPLQRFDEGQIVPTSEDRWRNQMLCGTVHDPTAALLGGVSGNAGIFSNANDLAVLAQMWLNGGEYGGERFLEDSTIQRFTMRQKGRRGFGFDKPPRHRNYHVAPSASLNTYGHTGFTGTCVWVDPEHELVYVFLSNRVHPDEKNYKINELRVRRRIHQVIYDLMDIPMRRVPYRPAPNPVLVIADKDKDAKPAATLSAP